MMFQKTKQTKSLFCTYARLQQSAMALQQVLSKKPELMRTIVDLVTRKKKSFYQLQGLREQDMEALYAAAYNCYVQERYEEAAILFRTFAFYSCFDLRAWTGLIGSLEQLSYYSKALLCRGIHERLSFKNSSSLFYAPDCYVLLYKISHSFRDQKHEQQQHRCYQETREQQQNW